MGSSRLPGKTLMPIMGKPMLAYQIERIRQSLLIDRVIIATSSSSIDDVIEQLAFDLDVLCFRGSEDDVLDRVVGALRKYNVQLHVEFQGDNPIPDPLIIDSIIGYYLKHEGSYDYVTNALRTTYPPGAEVSVYAAEVLYRAEQEVQNAQLREHVGIHIYQQPDKFNIKNIEAPSWLHAPTLHLEVDTEKDFEVISRIIQHFYSDNPSFSLQQVIEYMRSSGLHQTNSDVVRRWKAFRQDNE